MIELSLVEISGANDKETDCAPTLRQESAISSDPRRNLLLTSLSLADFASIRSNRDYLTLNMRPCWWKPGAGYQLINPLGVEQTATIPTRRGYALLAVQSDAAD